MQYITGLVFINLLIWSLWVWRYRVKPFFANRRLNHDLKNNVGYARLKKTERLLIELYKNINTKKISHNERRRLALTEDAYIYGEIEFLAFYQVLQKTAPKAHEIFYDLGSGAGKAIFTAACYFKLKKICGIEKLPTLHATAHSLVQKSHELADHLHCFDHSIGHIEFINQDFLKFNFTDGDIIFINATCFPYHLWDILFAKLLLLKAGSRVVVSTKKIKHAEFAIIEEGMTEMSWGINSINIYRKV